MVGETGVVVIVDPVRPERLRDQGRAERRAVQRGLHHLEQREVLEQVRPVVSPVDHVVERVRGTETVGIARIERERTQEPIVQAAAAVVAEKLLALVAEVERLIDKADGTELPRDEVDSQVAIGQLRGQIRCARFRDCSMFTVLIDLVRDDTVVLRRIRRSSEVEQLRHGLIDARKRRCAFALRTDDVDRTRRPAERLTESDPCWQFDDDIPTRHAEVFPRDEDPGRREELIFRIETDSARADERIEPHRSGEDREVIGVERVRVIPENRRCGRWAADRRVATTLYAKIAEPGRVVGHRRNGNRPRGSQIRRCGWRIGNLGETGWDRRRDRATARSRYDDEIEEVRRRADVVESGRWQIRTQAPTREQILRRHLNFRDAVERAADGGGQINVRSGQPIAPVDCGENQVGRGGHGDRNEFFGIERREATRNHAALRDQRIQVVRHRNRDAEIRQRTRSG